MKNTKDKEDFPCVKCICLASCKSSCISIQLNPKMFIHTMQFLRACSIFEEYRDLYPADDYDNFIQVVYDLFLGGNH